MFSHSRASLRLSPAALVLSVLALSGCVESSTEPPAPEIPLDAVVFMTDDSQFKESEVTIHAGGTVRWISDTSFLTHSVTPDGHELWESAEGTGRGTPVLVVTFLEPGLYQYYCIYHGGSGMMGVISVEP
jgi:plastocyanin